MTAMTQKCREANLCLDMIEGDPIYIAAVNDRFAKPLNRNALRAEQLEVLYSAVAEVLDARLENDMLTDRDYRIAMTAGTMAFNDANRWFSSFGATYAEFAGTVTAAA